jgi:hypothetical protein
MHNSRFEPPPDLLKRRLSGLLLLGAIGGGLLARVQPR